jgi:hypothetical protein
MNPSRIAVLLLVLPGVTLAQVCAEIENDAERLACYDGRNDAPSSIAAEPQAAKIPEQPADNASAPPESAEITVAADDPEEFGKKEPFDAPKEYIEATIVEVAKPGAFVHLRLDNGQVWRETRSGSVRFKEGRKVTITEGIMSSYNLKMEGLNKIVKVRRVQ